MAPAEALCLSPVRGTPKQPHNMRLTVEQSRLRIRLKRRMLGVSRHNPLTGLAPAGSQMPPRRIATKLAARRRNAVVCALLLAGALVTAAPAAAALHGRAVFGHSHKRVCGSVPPE